MSILDVKNLTHTVGDKKLFSSAEMSLFGGEKMGLTGLNGAGKSTFINILIGETVPDSGYIKWNPRFKLGYLDQQAKLNRSLTVHEVLLGAYDEFFKHEKRIHELSELADKNSSDSEKLTEYMDEMSRLQAKLEAANFYNHSSEIDKISTGLGITAFGLNTQVTKLSGGQRAKVILAKLLLESPEVLLLDEPTNFLDVSHIDWLTKFLTAFKGSFILVSHDFAFLNNVVNCICDIEYGDITRYNGGYDSFVKQKEQRAERKLKEYESQQKEIAKLEDYVAKNIVRASTSKMAKSRQKKLDKIERIEKPKEMPKVSFLFPVSNITGDKLMTVDNLAVGYDSQLLPEISFELFKGDKIAITGFNGIGKTTFLKTISKKIPAIGGRFSFSPVAKINYYTQDDDFLTEGITPIDEIRGYFPLMDQKIIRGHLARCGLRNEAAMQKIETLSGGEKAKVRLCRIMLTPCNILLLDEPTNHLDVNAIEQLKTAIKLFEGGVVFVSHSKGFVKSTATKVVDFEKLFD